MSRQAPRREILRSAGGGIVAILLTGFGRPALAAAPPRRFDVRYQMRFGGVQIGSVRLIAEPEGQRVSLRARSRIDGLFGLVPSRSSDLRTELVDDGDGVRPLLFEGRDEKDDRLRESRVEYDRSGIIATVSLSQNGKRREAEIGEDDRRSAVDLLTALWMVRRDLEDDRLGRRDYTVFDGRKLHSMSADLVQGGGDAGLRIGLTEVGSDDGEEPEGPAVVRVSMDDGGRLLPSRVTSQRRPPWEAVLEKG